jgi:lipoprotein-releasing system permease protein
MLQGVWIGAIGTLMGAVLGIAISVFLGRYPLITLPASVYTLDHLPVKLDPLDVSWIVGLSIGISLLATIYPSRQAARMDPVEAIRHE